TQSFCLPLWGGVRYSSGGVKLFIRSLCFAQVVKDQGVLRVWNGLTSNLLKIVPYFGVRVSTFDFWKRICLYQNYYMVSPLSYKLTP
ncbi:hypothetical protein DBR06_SOUSAS22510007, partial [Sousa chinensis]